MRDGLFDSDGREAQNAVSAGVYSAREDNIPANDRICASTAGAATAWEQGKMKEAETRRVELFDTSLRDGMQQPNIDISVPNAVSLLQRMAAFGVQYAEIGFAGANKFVADLTGALASVDTGAMKLALFGRTRGRGTKVQDWPDVQFIDRKSTRLNSSHL